MNLASTTSTQTLTTAKLALSSDERWRIALLALAIAALLLLAGMAGGRMFADSSAAAAERRELRERNATLRNELARVRTELELEQSTREALDREVLELNDRVGELRSRLDFLNQQSGRRP
ncbi:MAG TPA: hypothetical protein VLM41_02035 [Steroidobacteraceae bacterium]|nr:hypothetical protein [Steroidobacteraceae bacterium]